MLSCTSAVTRCTLAKLVEGLRIVNTCVQWRVSNRISATRGMGSPWPKTPIYLNTTKSINTLIYTSELILCSTICVHSATLHNIHMYPCFLFAAIHHLKSSPTFSVRPRSSVGRDGRSNPEVVGSIPTEVKRFFLYLVWFPDPVY